MPPTPRRFLLLGAFLAADAVAAGAFGAHALRDTLSLQSLATFATAARYQMYHSLALLLVATLWAPLGVRAEGALRAAGWLFVAGILVFSGSLYTLALTGIGMFGAVAPVGGVAFLSGWAALIWAAIRADAA